MKKRILTLALSAVLVLNMVACGSNGASPSASSGTAEASTSDSDALSADAATPDSAADVDSVKIGVLLPTSGSYATSGATNLLALDEAVNIINNEYGGIQNLGGAKIELIISDTQADSEVAVAEMERLIEREKVDILLGGHNTVVANTLSQYCIQYDMPMVMTGAFGDAAYSTPNEVVFHIAGTATLTAAAENEKNSWLESKSSAFHGGKVFAYVYAADDYGRSVYEAQVATMEENGIEEIIGIPMETGSTDLSSQIMKLTGRDDIEYITCNIPMADSILLLRQLKEYDVAIPMFAAGAGFLIGDFLDQVGDAGEYVFSTATWLPDFCNQTWDPEFSWAMDQKCVDKLGYHTDETFSWAWEGIWTIWDALERTSSLDAQDLKKALKETKIEGEHMGLLMTAHPAIYFDTVQMGDVTLYNQNPAFTYLWGQARDGQYRIVYPEAYANQDYPMVYPVPAWSER